MLPISVLVPTRNSMSLLPKHLESMRAWRDVAMEVVAVDSHSNDGTLELLQREFNQPRDRVLTHPPGLYQSWNFGIAQCQARYIYVSTVGESITRAGLEALFTTAESSRADVVISPPRMVKMSGEAKEKVWPIHVLIAALKLDGSVAFDREAAQLFAVIHLTRGLLGSSASNLYRADVLQRFPFRIDFGTAGDLAWGLEHAGEVRLALVPETFSTFVFHPKSYAKSDYAVHDFNEKCLTLARASVARAGGETSSNKTALLLHELFSAWETQFQAKRRVTEAKRSVVWCLKPGAWQAHLDRATAARTLAARQQNAMLELATRLAQAAPRR